MRLNQCIAIEKGVKSKALRVETDLYHSLDKKPLFSGLTRVYKRKDDDGDTLPPETAPVQLKAGQVVATLTESLTRLFDVIATKDFANTQARADITVDGTPIATDIPVTYLMFLEKELEKLVAFIGRIPILDPTQTWHYDPARGVYTSEPVETVRTKKVPRNHVLAEATKEHPAQVQIFTEDVIVGTWEKTEFSGGFPADRIQGINDRLDKLRTAVKFAREEANSMEIMDVKVGAKILDYLFQE